MADLPGLAEELRDLRGLARRFARSAAAAEDLLQDTAVRALENAGSFMPGTGLRRWLVALMRNLWIDQRRRAIFQNRAASEYVHWQMIDGGSVPGSAEAAVELSETLALVDRLPSVQRTALLVGILGGKARACSELGISERAINYSIRAARSALAAQ